ncbi:aldo/keto reductase [Campylobacterota bacterium DY0563]
MKYIEFEEKKISKLSLGTVQFGLDYGIANIDGKPTDKEVKEIITYLYDNGINAFDTATSYGNSEERIGKVFKNLDKLFIISKLSSEDFLSKAEDGIKNSLKKLNVNSLFGLLLHDNKVLNNWNNESKIILGNLQKKGFIQNFGVSIYTSLEFNKALENEDIRFIQIPFNIFDLRAINEEWFDKVKAKGKLIFIRSVFLQGLLLIDKEKLPEKLSKAKEYLEQFEQFALNYEMTKSELALSFVDSVAKDAILLFGCDNLMQAKENLENYKNLKVLSGDQINEIIKAFKNISEDIYLPTRW